MPNTCSVYGHVWPSKSIHLLQCFFRLTSICVCIYVCMFVCLYTVCVFGCVTVKSCTKKQNLYKSRTPCQMFFSASWILTASHFLLFLFPFLRIPPLSPAFTLQNLYISRKPSTKHPSLPKPCLNGILHIFIVVIISAHNVHRHE